jgi:hypothetical protein
MYFDYIKNEYKFISIGFMCYGKKFINKYVEETETIFFDYIGSSVCAINDLIKNDFYIENHFLYNKKDYELYKTLTGEYIVANIKFYIKFMHDFVYKQSTSTIIDDEILNLKEKYTRRAYRFMNLLKEQKKILFIRLEEDMRNMTYNIHKTKFETTELEHLK